jgi:hypothetical protein
MGYHKGRCEASIRPKKTGPKTKEKTPPTTSLDRRSHNPHEFIGACGERHWFTARDHREDWTCRHATVFRILHRNDSQPKHSRSLRASSRPVLDRAVAERIQYDSTAQRPGVSSTGPRGDPGGTHDRASEQAGTNIEGGPKIGGMPSVMGVALVPRLVPMFLPMQSCIKVDLE